MIKNLKECEQLMIDFAKEKDFKPEDMLDSFQTALLNIADWMCECMKYSNDKRKKFMNNYVKQIEKAVNRRFLKTE